MSLLPIAALLAAAATAIVIGCVAYILTSFRRSGHLLASRIGRQPPALVLTTDQGSRRWQPPKSRSIAARQLSLQPATSS